MGHVLPRSAPNLRTQPPLVNSTLLKGLGRDAEIAFVGLVGLQG